MAKELITFACMSTPRLDNLKKLVPKVLPYVDRAIIVIGRKEQESVDYLKSLGPKMSVVYRQWDDNFANQWNVYLGFVKEGWVLVMDDDEVPSEDMLKSLTPFVDESDNGNKYCTVEYRSHPIGEGGHDIGPSNYYRQVFTRYNSNMVYVGGTKTGCHQFLINHQNSKIARSDHVYHHIKNYREEYRNAARNYFIYGLWPHGSKDGIQKEEWHELKAIVGRNYPEAKTFMEVDDILIKGNVHPELKEWMARRYEQYKETEGYNEMRAFCLYYTKYLHPNEFQERN